MSELLTSANNITRARQVLFSTSSAIALAAVISVQDACADNSMDRPTVWVEFGAQAEHIGLPQQPFAPSFIENYSDSKIHPTSLVVDQSKSAPRYAIGGEGKLSFSPEASVWIFSAQAKFGRANSSRRFHNEATVSHLNSAHVADPENNPTSMVPGLWNDLNDSRIELKERHVILDFQAGRDIGVGFWGSHSQSELHFGLRAVQFNTQSSDEMRARPDVGFYNKYVRGLPLPLGHYHDFHAIGEARRSFSGLGPSVSWQNKIDLTSGDDAVPLTADLGINAAALFGRQKATVTHQTTGYYQAIGLGLHPGTPHHTTYSTGPQKIPRKRSIVVPNVGGFAALSFRYPNAKVSFGYRADIYFGALDGGVYERQSKDVNFHGPFATISIGLGG